MTDSRTPSSPVSDGDLRMLGTRDGLSHALIWVRQHIAIIKGPYSPRIHPRHTRKLKAREAVLRPLLELEARIAKSHADTQEAYRKSARGHGETANAKSEGR